MQFRLWISLTIFIGSYFPLSLILLVQNLDMALVGKPPCFPLSATCLFPVRNAVFALSIFVLCIACFAATLIVLRALRTKHAVAIRNAAHVPADLMNYTLPYVVSFMSIDYQEMSKFIGFIIFLGWMFWITHRSGQILLNPLLIVFGWRLYDVEYSFKGEDQVRMGRALVAGDLEPGAEYPHVLVQDVLVIKPGTPA